MRHSQAAGAQLHVDWLPYQVEYPNALDPVRFRQMQLASRSTFYMPAILTLI